MIRRDNGSDWLLIAQIDHARLAAEIAAVWGNDAVPPLPVPDLLVPAIRHHDDGWQEWAAAPQIDPETGRPLNFTEMPMAVSTAIWEQSIDICGHGGGRVVSPIQRFREFLAMREMRLTPEKAMIVQEVFLSEEPFDFQQLVKRLEQRSGGRRISSATIHRTIGLLLESCLIRKIDTANDRDVYDASGLTPSPSPLSGIWVSRHFCWLAENARESRHNNAEDLAAIEKFLEVQAELQQRLKEKETEQTRELVSMTPNLVDSLVETGFRFLQFFDALSIWLCCEEQSEPHETTTPENGAICWTPLGQTPRPRYGLEIHAEPFPLSVDRLELSVPARIIPVREYADDADLQAALQTSTSGCLKWAIVP